MQTNTEVSSGRRVENVSVHATYGTFDLLGAKFTQRVGKQLQDPEGRPFAFLIKKGTVEQEVLS